MISDNVPWLRIYHCVRTTVLRRENKHYVREKKNLKFLSIRVFVQTVTKKNSLCNNHYEEVGKLGTLNLVHVNYSLCLYVLFWSFFLKIVYKYKYYHTRFYLIICFDEYFSKYQISIIFNHKQLKIFVIKIMHLRMYDG
jgi:hypothetical protein